MEVGEAGLGQQVEVIQENGKQEDGIQQNDV